MLGSTSNQHGWNGPWESVRAVFSLVAETRKET